MSTKKLCELLKDMDIPIQRKSTMNKNNLEWLQKHLGRVNSNHRNYEAAIQEIDRRLEQKIYDN